MKSRIKLFINLVLMIAFQKLIYCQPIMDIQAELDFGVIPQYSDPYRALTFYNIGDVPLELKDVKASSGVITVSYSTDPVAPGDSAIIGVNYDTKRVGVIVKTLYIESNESVTRKVDVRGEVVASTSIHSMGELPIYIKYDRYRQVLDISNSLINSSGSRYNYRIYDLGGKLVKHGSLLQGYSISVENLSTGCYFIAINGPNNSAFSKSFVRI